MSGSRRRLLTQLKLEADSIYRFPIIEILACFILFATVLGLGTISVELGAEATVGAGLNTTEILVQNNQALEYLGRGVLVSTSNSLTVLFILIVPLFTTFVFAAGFEDGSHRTFLSYPVTRNQVLFLRFLVLLLFSVTTVVSSVVLVATISFPSLLGSSLLYISMLGISIFIILMISSSVLIAVVTRKTMVSAICSLGIWYSILIVLNTESVSAIIRTILIPSLIIQELIGEGSFALSDILISFCSSVIVSIVFLTISAYIFRQAEV